MDNTSDNPNYGLNQFKTNGVMDYVKIVSLKPVHGGCSKHTVKKHERVFSNHIYKFNVISQTFRDNNCGIQCLRQIVPMDGSPEDIRRKYKITLKTKLTFEELNQIYINEIKNDHRPLIFITEQTTGKIDQRNFNYLFLDNTHYYNVESIEELTPARKVKRGSLYWDIETRLTENKVYIKSKDNNGKIISKESRILKDVITAIYYKPNRGTEYFRQVFTTNTTISSVRQFADWLINQAQNNHFYRCCAHNGSRFDIYVLLASFTKQETLLSTMNLRGSSIIGMNFFNHEFIDSCCHLLNSLDNLCKSYKVETPKLKTFKYRVQEFTNEQLCFYKTNSHL